MKSITQRPAFTKNLGFEIPLFWEIHPSVRNHPWLSNIDFIIISRIAMIYWINNYYITSNNFTIS